MFALDFAQKIYLWYIGSLRDAYINWFPDVLKVVYVDFTKSPGDTSWKLLSYKGSCVIPKAPFLFDRENLTFPKERHGAGLGAAQQKGWPVVEGLLRPIGSMGLA